MNPSADRVNTLCPFDEITPNTGSTDKACESCSARGCKHDWKTVVCGSQYAGHVSSYIESNATAQTSPPEVTASYQVAVEHVVQAGVEQGAAA